MCVCVCVFGRDRVVNSGGKGCGLFVKGYLLAFIHFMTLDESTLYDK